MLPSAAIGHSACRIDACSQAAAPAAHAQDAPTAALAEVVVTATRREQSIQDIPFNISAVGGEALEKANIIDAVEALRTMAGHLGPGSRLSQCAA